MWGGLNEGRIDEDGMRRIEKRRERRAEGDSLSEDENPMKLLREKELTIWTKRSSSLVIN